MHLTLRFNVIVKGGNARLRPLEHRVQLFQSPSEVIAVVVQVDVRVLARVKAGRRVRQHVFKESENSQGNFPKEGVAGNLVGAQVISQKAGVVVRHFLEVGHDPALVHRVAVKAAADLVVDTTPPHMFEGGSHHGQQPLLAGLEISLEEQIDGAGVGKFGGVAEPAVLRIEHAGDAFDDRLHHLFVSRRLPFLKVIHLAESLGNLRGAFLDLVAMRAVVVRDGFQQALHARAAGAVVRREVSASIERLAVRGEKGRERPAALAGQGAHRHLVASVDVGTLVAIDLYGDERVVDNACHLGVFVALAVHHVAPVAPHGANVEQDGLILRLRQCEGGAVPFAPKHGLMRGGAQVGAGGLRQFVPGVLKAHRLYPVSSSKWRHCSATLFWRSALHFSSWLSPGDRASGQGMSRLHPAFSVWAQKPQIGVAKSPEGSCRLLGCRPAEGCSGEVSYKYRPRTSPGQPPRSNQYRHRDTAEFSGSSPAPCYTPKGLLQPTPERLSKYAWDPDC